MEDLFWNKKCFLIVKLLISVLSFFPIYLEGVFKSFSYFEYSNMIYFLSEENMNIWEEHQKMKIVCAHEYAH